MCGILAIVNNGNKTTSSQLLSACSIIRHRGPDDEGFLTWNGQERPIVWAGADTAASTRAHWNYETLEPETGFRVGFGHRRLSILDLSPAGHQPMLHEDAGLSITFNGEVYNYLEIKAELEKLGHHFKTRTDTEVILHAWQEWGVSCLQRFNGMFAFVLLDERKKELYAVRDRFGVKPLYYAVLNDALYLASEIKQIRTAPGYGLKMNMQAARQYLASGAVDQTDATFDLNIKNIPQGHYLKYNLASTTLNYSLHKWYELQLKQWTGSYEDAAEELRNILTDAVNVRLRSDVPVGSCLSGGLDSSSIVCIVAELLKQRGETAGQETVTACYDEARFDEWRYAEEVIRKTNARPHRTFPSFGMLEEEVNNFIWHQDEPTGSTSQYSQWAVFKASHDAHLKVMVDGQGADEQFAGYGGNDLSFYTGLLKSMKVGALYDEARHYKKENGHWPKGFLINAGKLAMGQRVGVEMATWMRPAEPTTIYDQPAHSLRDNLLRQLYQAPLPALLRYEDRNSMAWSVESRTPFMDYRLVEFTLGLPERFVYKRGVRKAVLRTAMQNVIPAAINERRDKMGFVTPEELWLRGEGRNWFVKGVTETCNEFGEILDTKATLQLVNNMADAKQAFNFIPWRILCLGVWHKMIS